MPSAEAWGRASGVRRLADSPFGTATAADSQGLRGLRIAGLQIGAREVAMLRLRTPPIPAFVGGFGGF
eukprot:630883-Alexandrium_andersonii.AAC.1